MSLKRLRRFRISTCLLLLATGAHLGGSRLVAQSLPAQRYVVLIAGLGGEQRYTDIFRDHLFETRRAFIDKMGVPESNVTVMSEITIAEEPFVSDVSTADNIESVFGRLADTVTGSDELFVVLFGHGSFDGSEARLNIPRKDLTDGDYARLLGRISADKIIFINTASASGPFVETLAGRDRIVIAATRTGSQRNATMFPTFFVDALAGGDSDLDKDGALSLMETFRYAATETARHYEADGQLATEFAILDDNGDGEGHRLEELQEAGEGALANVLYLSRALGSWSDIVMTKPEIAPFLLERDDLEQQIALLKTERSAYSEDEYYQRLERVFVQLARLSVRIDSLSGS